MIRPLAVLAVLVVVSWMAQAQAEQRTVTLHVDNMTCALCPITVGKAIEGVAGVERVSVSVAEQTATVVYDDAVATAAEIALAPGEAGYPAWPIDQ